MFLFSCTGKYTRKTNLVGFEVKNWVCVYNADAPSDQVRKFDLAVLDPDSHPDLGTLHKTTLLFAYLSLGEVGDYRWYWPEISNKSWILEKNPNWNSFMIDVRDDAWHDFVIDRLIPRILEQGFRGIFLDTIDNAEYLEKYHPSKTWPGAQKAMVRLIRKIRKNYPNVLLLANRGFAILNEIGNTIDGVVAESIFTDYDFKAKRVRLRPESEYAGYLNLLSSAQKKHNLVILTLDYTDAESEGEIRNVIRKSRDNKFVPYVSTIGLDKIHFNTLENRL